MMENGGMRAFDQPHRFLNDRPQRKATRSADFDYSYFGYYFVTICTKNREPNLGKVEDCKVILSSFGRISRDCLLSISRHFHYVSLDKFIIMPDHIHLILYLRRPVGDADLRPLRAVNDGTKSTLAKVIHGFKSSVTRMIHRKSPEIYFAWQRSYFDRVIRNRLELNMYRRYIHENPQLWSPDSILDNILENRE